MVIKAGFTGSAESPRRHENELEDNFQRLRVGAEGFKLH
jgi:hypothetical protein